MRDYMRKPLHLGAALARTSLFQALSWRGAGTLRGGGGDEFKFQFEEESVRGQIYNVYSGVMGTHNAFYDGKAQPRACRSAPVFSPKPLKYVVTVRCGDAR